MRTMCAFYRKKIQEKKKSKDTIELSCKNKKKAHPMAHRIEANWVCNAEIDWINNVPAPNHSVRIITANLIMDIQTVNSSSVFVVLRRFIVFWRKWNGKTANKNGIQSMDLMDVQFIVNWPYGGKNVNLENDWFVDCTWCQSNRYFSFLFFASKYQLLGVRIQQNNQIFMLPWTTWTFKMLTNQMLYTQHIPSTNVKFMSKIRVRAFLRSQIANMRNKSTHRAANSALAKSLY